MARLVLKVGWVLLKKLVPLLFGVEEEPGSRKESEGGSSRGGGRALEAGGKWAGWDWQLSR